MGNLYQTEEKKDRQYGKGGQLLRDEHWHYLYDANGNLTKKTKYKPIPEAKLKAAEQRKEEMKHEQRHFFDWLLRYKEPDPVEALREEVPQAEAPWEYGQWQYEWQGNGMLKSVRKPDGTHVRFEYDALGRRTAKVLNGQIQRVVYDGNVLLHQWEYGEKDRPKTVTDEVGMLKIDKEEPVENLVTWVFEEGTFVPEAKITEEGTYPIISDYLGTPVLAFDGDGNQVWERELDIYGNPRIGDNTFCPFLYQGQYYDEETGLAYNRFRYYNPETGLYISKDPLDIRGGMPNNYSYVANSRIQIDPFGLMAKPSSFFTDSGGLTLKVKNQQDLSHMSDSQLRYMSENGVAGTTMGGNRGRQTIVLHHQGQQNGGPIIEMPKSTHRNINKKQHPHFPNPHPTDKVDRLRFDDWKKEYWKDRANKEMEKRKGKVKCKL